MLDDLRELAGRYGSELTNSLGHPIESLEEDTEFLSVQLVVSAEDMEDFQGDLGDEVGRVDVKSPPDDAATRQRVNIEILFDR